MELQIERGAIAEVQIEKKCKLPEEEIDEVGIIANDDKFDIEDHLEDDMLRLEGNRKIRVIRSACGRERDESGGKMHVMKGVVNKHMVTTLRNTGCSVILVEKKYVMPEQYTGKEGNLLLVDNTIRRVPYAKVDIDTLL